MLTKPTPGLAQVIASSSAASRSGAERDASCRASAEPLKTAGQIAGNNSCSVRCHAVILAAEIILVMEGWASQRGVASYSVDSPRSVANRSQFRSFPGY